MNLIKNNPYRILGILAGATARVQEKQVRKLKQYIDAEKTVDDDYSFPSLGKNIRTETSVTEASSQLTLALDKMNAALFWFYNGNAISDEPALEFLQDADQKSCISIWIKLTGTGEISQRNSSAYQNLSTLYLCNSFNGPFVNKELLFEAVRLKLKFIDSDFSEEFIKIAAGDALQISKKDIQLSFIDHLCKEIFETGYLTQTECFELFQKIDFTAKSDFLKRYIKKSIDQVEKNLSESKKKRQADNSNSIVIGNELYNLSLPELTQIKAVHGTTHTSFSSLSDKLAAEILQCAIHYFDHCNKNNQDTQNVLQLVKKAKKIALGEIIKQRCLDSEENLQEWINDKPVRDKRESIASDLAALIDILEKHENKPQKKFQVSIPVPRILPTGSFDMDEPINHVKSLIIKCKPFLKKIKGVLGPDDELYLNISTKVANTAQNGIVENVNKSQESISARSRDDAVHFMLLKFTLEKAWEITALLEILDMKRDFRLNRYVPNKSNLKSLCQKLSIDTQDVKTRLQRTLEIAKQELHSKQQWHFLRSESDKQQQISEQEKKISYLRDELNHFEL